MNNGLNCKEVMDGITGLTPDALPAVLENHLHDCDACRERWEAQCEVMWALRPRDSVVASDAYQERVMKAILEERIAENGQRPQRGRGWLRWTPAAIAAAVLLLAIPFFTAKRGPSPGASLLAQSAGALAKVQSVHIQGRMRTVAGDNFELIGAEYEFVPIELWREYGERPRWRVEKPGRVAVMDGTSATMYIERSNSAAKGDPSAGFVEWLKPLLDPQAVLEHEARAANAGEALVEVDLTGALRAVSVKRFAKGDFRNAWAMNKSIQEADHTCTYRFDAASGLPASLVVTVQTAGGAVAVAEFDRFVYNEPMADSLFVLEIPKNATWLRSDGGPGREATITFAGPREAAAYFFETLGRKDWDGVLAVYPHTSVAEAVRSGYGGVVVAQLGEAFQSGLYKGWFVPYEVRMPDGRMKKHTLAVRNDNPQRRWVVDGGY